MVWFEAAKIAKAIRRGDNARLAELLNNGADPNAAEDMGRFPLELAVHCGNKEAVDLLIAHDAAPELYWNDGSLLHLAARMGRVDIAQALLAKWPDMLREKDDYGNTPLHLAAERGHVEMVSYLIDCGLNPHDKNRENRTPLFLAEKARHQDVIDILTACLESIEKPQLPLPQKLLAAQKEAAPEDGWQQLDKDKIALVKTEETLGYRVTEIFNFAARERTTLYRNLTTQQETVVIKNFDDITEKAPLEEALAELQKRGGRGSISGIRKP